MLEVGIRFTHTISRKPGQSVSSGIRTGGGPDPDPVLFAQQHEAYLAALEAAGVATICLPALEAYPDSVFVEDPALCLPEGAILLRPGAPSRAGEAEALGAVLAEHFSEVAQLPGPGLVDGGDIMVTDDEILVGLSARTNKEGFAALQPILKRWGYRARMVETPASILHFKTASAYLGNNIVLCTQAMAYSDAFDGYDLLQVPDGEEAAANTIRVNDTILMPAGYPMTAEIVTLHFPDQTVVELDISQAALVDGGLSCMSLRFAK